MRIKPKSRVEYVGSTCPMLTGRRGTFVRYDNKGWAHVLFDCNPVGSVKCAVPNLKVISNDN